jgi:hypothetical protein
LCVSDSTLSHSDEAVAGFRATLPQIGPECIRPLTLPDRPKNCDELWMLVIKFRSLDASCTRREGRVGEYQWK